MESILSNVRGDKEFSDSVQESANVSVIFLVVGISGVITCPVESAVVIPNREDIFLSDCNRFLFLSKDFSHQGQKILCRIAINSDNFIALLRRKLFHDGLNHAIGVFVKLLEVMAKIPHDMGTVQNSF